MRSYKVNERALQSTEWRLLYTQGLAFKYKRERERDRET